MQNVTTKFNRIFGDICHRYEAKAVVAGVTYPIGNLYSAEIDCNVLQNNVPGVGGTVAKLLSLAILPQGDIPKGAQVDLYIRAVTDTEQSEWVPKGRYFVEYREESSDGEFSTFDCSDAMLKGDVPYIDETALPSWPQSETAVVKDIAAILGVTLDSSVSLKGYSIPHPIDYTCREILGFIGGANGGNWTITDANKLKLIKFPSTRKVLSSETHIPILFGNTFLELHTPSASGSNETNVERMVETFDNLGKLPPYTGVTVWVNDDDSFKAGDTSGSVLEFDCPWATQEMANNVLGEIQGYSYQAFSATHAELTPAAELGDVVGIDGVFGQVMSLRVSIDGSYLPDISAPADSEMETEYPYESATSRAIRRGTAEAKTEAAKALTTAEKIANGTYDGGTFIDKTTIHAPNIFGAATLHIGANGGASEDVNDNYNFNVDKSGNVTSHGNAAFDGQMELGGSLALGGNITLAENGSINLTNGSITWGANNSPVTARYSANGTIPSGDTPGTASNWHDELQATDYFAAYSYDGGITWTDAVRIRGMNGQDGSDANVTFENVNDALGQLFRDFAGGAVTEVTDSYIYSPQVKGGEFYGGAYYAGTGHGYMAMEENELALYDAAGNKKMWIGYYSVVPSGQEENPRAWTTYPMMQLGIGSGTDSSGGGLMMKFGKGVWLGDSSVKYGPGNYPGGASSVTDIPYWPNATGIFVDLNADKVYQYINGSPTELRRINYGTVLPTSGMREGDIFFLLSE